jgi:hypothetical protein
VLPGQPTGPASGSSSGALSSAQLQSILLQPGDLPSTWTGTTYKPDSSSTSEQAAALKQCLGVKDTSPDQVGVAYSDEYTMANADITSVARSFNSEADVQSDEAGYLGDNVDNCFDKVVRADAGGLPPGTTLDDVTMVFTPGSAGLASNVVGIGRGEVQVTQNGDQVILYEDIAFIRGPMIEAEIEFENPAQPVDSTLENQLNKTVAARVAA